MALWTETSFSEAVVFKKVLTNPCFSYIPWVRAPQSQRRCFFEYVFALLSRKALFHAGMALRRRNTRYKNPQLVAQHCFVASFCRCFPFFTFRDQPDPQQKHLLPVEESCCEKKCAGLLWATNFGFVARFSSNSQLVAQQICSCASKSTNQRAAFIQPTTNVFVAGQVALIAPGEKRETSTKTCNETMFRDKLRVIVSPISPPLNQGRPSTDWVSTGSHQNIIEHQTIGFRTWRS